VVVETLETVYLVSSRLKKSFEAFFASRITKLSSIGLTPNALTVLGVLSSAFAALLYASWRMSRIALPAAGALILLSGFMDALDGVSARSSNKSSAFGGFLDSVSDRYSDSVVLASIVLAGLCDPAWGLVAIIGSLMVSYTRSRAEAAGVSMAAVGFAERAERMLILAAVTFLAFFWFDFLGWGVILIGVVAHITVLQRTFHFYNSVKRV